MQQKLSLHKVLYLFTQIGLGIFGLIMTYFLVLSLLAFLGMLPKYFDATLEVPVSLDHPSTYYEAKSLDNHFSVKHIEIKKANLELKTKDRSWPQGLGYLHAAFYLGFYAAMLFLLTRMFRNFSSPLPFSPKNVKYLRLMGICCLGLACYEFLVYVSVSSLFADKVHITHGHALTSPSAWSFNWLALFLGLILMSLSAVFKTGADLQELEEQTV